MGIVKILFALTVLAICSGGVSSAGPSEKPMAKALTHRQKAVSDEIISIFENDTPSLQYGYIENLHDGRGYTAGRGGFTTGTGDLLTVLRVYAKLEPNNPFIRYLPRLEQKAGSTSDSIDDLDGFVPLWAASAKAPKFRKAQDLVVDRLAYKPALKHWREEGCQTPLALLVLYDTVIEHGDDQDPDGTPAVIKSARERAGGNPRDGISEFEWLEAFLQVRRETLENPSDEKTKEVWADSASRCDALGDILRANNTNLRTPIAMTVFGEAWTVSDGGASKVELE